MYAGNILMINGTYSQGHVML